MLLNPTQRISVDYTGICRNKYLRLYYYSGSDIWKISYFISGMSE